MQKKQKIRIGRPQKTKNLQGRRRLFFYAGAAFSFTLAPPFPLSRRRFFL